MKLYAGIGSRTLSESQLEFCRKVGFFLARENWALKTGAAQGADQAFTEGAISGGGQVHLYIPWPNYRGNWIPTLPEKQIKVKVLGYQDKEAYNSVDKYHPNPSILTRAVRSLHARNFLILERCVFVLAYPTIKPNGQKGGTGQGIRIAKDLKIRCFDLSEKEDYDKVARKLG